ncbi:hypothetical protein SAMN05442782_10447 [Streptomyces sp. OK228]|nr:hypothetical protein SAMN05442782_10447 [Streptomyces sp. OK228]
MGLGQAGYDKPGVEPGPCGPPGPSLAPHTVLRLHFTQEESYFSPAECTDSRGWPRTCLS